MKIAQLKIIADCIAAGDLESAHDAIREALKNETGKAWHRDLTKLGAVLANPGHPQFKVFAKDGNQKLPFLAFSALPGKGFCPGAGDCINFCYSFRAWRYPAAFARQAQNSVMLQSEEGRKAILAELDKFERFGPMPFRLYVDGDFSSFGDVVFWMRALNERLWLGAYGYSKSWAELLDFDRFRPGQWPTNYKLNLSSGSIHDSATREAVATLPITRGEFVAVGMARKVKSADHGDRAHQKELREVYGKPAFTCPGNCGDCTPKGHACGSSRFDGVDIIIAVH